MRFFAAISVFFLWKNCAGFNLDTEFPVFYNGSKGSYFGYTVALFENSRGPVALVGAPRANSTTIRPKVYEPGALFRCDIPNSGNDGTCIEIGLLKEGNNRTRSGNKAYLEKWDGMWLGVSLDVRQSDFQKDVVVCAHLWKNAIDLKELYVNGNCYLIDADLDESSVRKLLPLVEGDKRYFEDAGGTEYRYAYGQAGISAAFSEDASNLVLGAPGILTWDGSAVKYNIYPGGTFPFYDEPAIPFPVFDADFNSYFGYSITTGKFLKSKTQQYAAGAPRDGSNHGVVYVVAIDRRFQIYQKLRGDQLGEYFGACVLGVDLNGDSLSDLLVGSPFHSVENAGDEGKVYVYISNGKDLQKQTEIAGDTQPSARFGTAIANIGDINQDGFTDIAIGAPYEGGRGAVYIYHGSRFGLKFRYVQKIEAAVIDSKLSGFGIHISRGYDIDDNKYPDILVGSYASSHAVLFRSRPIIRVYADLTFHPKQIVMNVPCDNSLMNLTCVQINACLYYDGKHAPSTLAFRLTLHIQDNTKRAFFEEDASQVLTSTKSLEMEIKNTECYGFRMFLYPGIKNVITPIKVQFSNSLKPPAGSELSFDKSFPVYDPASQTDVTSNIPFHTGCGKEDECRSNLRVTVRRSDPPESIEYITLGRESSVSVEIVIQNDGEPAYLSELHITIPPEMRAINQDICEDANQQQNPTLVCDTGNPLRNDSQVRIRIKLDTTKVPPHTEYLEIVCEVFTLSTEADLENNIAVLALYFETVYDIGVTGITFSDQIMYHGTQTLSTLISHTYIVRNHGPSPLQTIDFSLGIPTEIIANDGLKTFLVLTSVLTDLRTLSSVPVSCDIASLNMKSVETPPKHRTKTTDEGKLSIQEVEKILNATSLKGPAPKPNELKMSVETDKKKDVSHSEKDNEDKIKTPKKRILRISCDSENIRCSKLQCTAFSFTNPRRYAEISVSFQVNFTVLDKYSSPWYHLELITNSSIMVNVVGNKGKEQGIYPDVAQVKTDILHEGPPPAEEVESWIIFLSIGLGILLLIILLVILIKVGFFRRKEKDKMKEMKSGSVREKKKEDEVEITEEDQCEDQCE